MLTEVKNQIKVTFLSIKYAIMREMLNKVSFITNVVFMVINNSFMIIQWVILFSLKDDIGGYTLKQVLLVWGMAAGTYGVSRFFFKKSFELADIINSGKLDAYLVQPKNVLISVITSDISVSALGDILYGFIVYFIYGFDIVGFILFIIFCITGGIILVSVSVILSSLSFWINNSEMIADIGNSLCTNFSTYPDGIFKGLTKWLLFTIVPVGIANYIPVRIIINFNPWLLLINIGVCGLFILVASIIFNQGLKRYSSSNLMSARL